MSLGTRIDALSTAERVAAGTVALLVGAGAILSLMTVSPGGVSTPVLALAGVALLTAGTLAVGTSVSGRNA